MFGDMLKHQSFSKISGRFIKHIGKKYNNKISAGEYIIERFIDKKIHIGYSYKQSNYTPFFNIANKFNNFHVVFNSHEPSIGFCALSYAKNTNNIGLILSSSTYGFANICKSLKNSKYDNIPLLLMSFYDKESESKLTKSLKPERQYIKEYHNINDINKLPNLLEYTMMLSELYPKGSVHINICNSILNKPVKFDDLILDKLNTKLLDEGSQSQNMLPDKENLSLLQYYEEGYEECEKYENFIHHK
tara:strand:+ start:1503 stop:2240 length:738 start_codon:yes stop_codon:yes gene_type:complete